MKLNAKKICVLFLISLCFLSCRSNRSGWLMLKNQGQHQEVLVLKSHNGLIRLLSKMSQVNVEGYKGKTVKIPEDIQSYNVKNAFGMNISIVDSESDLIFVEILVDPPLGPDDDEVLMKLFILFDAAGNMGTTSKIADTVFMHRYFFGGGFEFYDQSSGTITQQADEKMMLLDVDAVLNGFYNAFGEVGDTEVAVYGRLKIPIDNW